MHHRLFVAALMIGEYVGVLLKRLPDPGDVAVPENAPASGEERRFHTVALDVLLAQKQDDRLSSG